MIQSNRQSQILSGLQDSGQQDLSYDMRDSYPIIAKEYRELTSQTTAAGAMTGQEVSFVLNKSGLLTDMYLRCVFTTTTDTLVATTYPGLNMLEWMELRTNNKTLCRFYHEAIKAWVSDQDSDRQISITRAALPLVDVTEIVQTNTLNATATYIPVPSFVSQSIKNAYDLSFNESLSLVCKFNTPTKANFVNSAATITSIKLWYWHYYLNDPSYQVLLAKNMNPSQPMNQLLYSTYVDKLLCTYTTSNTVTIRNNFAAFKTLVFLQQIALSGADVKINSFDFTVGGISLLESVPCTVGKHESHMKGAGSLRATSITAVSMYDTKPICINWGQDPKDMTYNSGALSFGNISNCQVTLNHPSITAANYNIVAVHFYWLIGSFDASNGSVSAIVVN